MLLPRARGEKVADRVPGRRVARDEPGDRREAIFRNDADREWFLNTLGEACKKTGWSVHAFCMMGNHFHLGVETSQGNLVAGVKRLLGTCTGRSNRCYRLSGHLFGGRYRALIVDATSKGYLRAVCEYVHLIPLRAKLLEPTEALRAYRCWSSWPVYLQRPEQRPAWLRVDQVLRESGIARGSRAGRRQFERVMEEWRHRDSPEDYRQIRRGPCRGEEAFRKELLAMVGGRRGAPYYGEELRKLGEAETELARHRKGDPTKVELAARMRAGTTMTLSWIATRLGMGTRPSLSNLLSARRC